MQSNEARYWADMTAASNLEICQEAKCELIRCDRRGTWRWRHGMRSSADQYCKTFETKDEAAADFVQSREFHNWLRSRGVCI